MQAIDTRAYRGTLHRTTAALVAWHAGASPERALEPALPIIDPHHHLYGDAEQAHHYRLESLAEDLSGGHRVTATVYVEAYEAGWRATGPHGLRSVGEVERIVGLSRQPLALSTGPCRVAAGIVAHADLTLGDVVRLNYYTTDIPAYLKASGEVKHRFPIDRPPPAGTLLGVASLFHPDILVEIEASACG